MKIANITQHVSTDEQRTEGVFDLFPEDRARLTAMLTFDPQYTRKDLEVAAEEIVGLLKEYDCYSAMIGGMPSFMSVLEKALIKAGVAVCYARSERVSIDQVQADGSVRKVATFRHAGLYWASQAMHACVYCSRSQCIAYTNGESICG